VDESPRDEPEDLTRGDMRLLRGALRNDWPIPDPVRRRLLQALINIVDRSEYDLEEAGDEDEEARRRPTDWKTIAAMKTIALFCDLALKQQKLDLAREKLAAGKTTEGTLADCVADAERLAGERELERQRDGEGRGEP
jgi:hypothetical protein